MAEKERGAWVVGDMYSLAEILSWSILWNNYFQGLWFHIMNMLTWANAKDKATSIAKCKSTTQQLVLKLIGIKMQSEKY